MQRFSLKTPAKKPNVFNASNEVQLQLKKPLITLDDPVPSDIPPRPVEEDESVDELDAFMAENEEQRKVDLVTKKEPPPRRDDIEEEDMLESFMKFQEENKKELKAGQVEVEELEYDMDGNPIVTSRIKEIQTLEPLDHSKIQYYPFEKNFWEDHEEIAGMSPQEVLEYRAQLGISISPANSARPVKEFRHFNFDTRMLAAIEKAGYSRPSPIQCQAVPVLLSGHDLIGIAKTGSGKTAAFLWPMIVHIMDQPELDLANKEFGPIGIIVAPTRELGQQIYDECKKFCRPYGLKGYLASQTTKVMDCFGGTSKGTQWMEMRQGVEIVVATPGRLIDLIKMKGVCKTDRVTYLVIDEADKLFDFGFEPQIRSIVGQLRPDRQTCFFSATFPKHVQKLTNDILTEPVRLTVGADSEVLSVNADVTQHTIVLNEESEKWPWLSSHLRRLLALGSVLIFVGKKASADTLTANLVRAGIQAAALHGNKDQTERTKIIHAFKSGSLLCMVATDVAARGLDIPLIKTVVNYETAKDIQSHIHRIGRTGRAGTKDGSAYTLVLPNEVNFAAELVLLLEQVRQQVPVDLRSIAMRSKWFRAGGKLGERGVHRKGRGGRGGAGAGRGGGRAVGARGGIGFDDGEGEGEGEGGEVDRGAGRHRAALNPMAEGLSSNQRLMLHLVQFKSGFKKGETYGAGGRQPTLIPALVPKELPPPARRSPERKQRSRSPERRERRRSPERRDRRSPERRRSRSPDRRDRREERGDRRRDDRKDRRSRSRSRSPPHRRDSRSPRRSPRR